MDKGDPNRSASDRVTVTLLPGQLDQLRAIADHNNVKVAFVVRHALTDFLGRMGDRQFTFDFRLPLDR